MNLPIHKKGSRYFKKYNHYINNAWPTYHEYVVPKSIPITVPISSLPSSLSLESASKGSRHNRNKLAVLIFKISKI